jgi:hypothetical protein
MSTERPARSVLGRISVTIAGAFAGLFMLGTIGSRLASTWPVAAFIAVLGAALGTVAGFVLSGRAVEPAAWKVWATILVSFLLGMVLPSLQIGYLFNALMPAAVMAAGLIVLWGYEAQRKRANEAASL